MLLLASAVLAQGQTHTTMGTDFWVGFMPNNRQRPSSNPNTLSLLITAPTAATGTVSCGGDSFTFTVPPDSMTRVTIPSRTNYFNTNTSGLHVTTSQPVSLYASNHTNYSHDITGVLPTPTLGTDYVLQSYQFHGSGGVDNQFCIIATQNNTTVHYQLGDTGTAVHTIQLQAGQAFQWEENLDLSGTHVWTTDCNKPIAVFSGHECAYVPSGYASGDHIFEQSIPIDYWGRHFIVTSSMGRRHDLLRVTALTDNTTFTFADTTCTLQARQTAEIDILSDSLPAAYLESDKPVSVFLYLTGQQYGSHIAQMGDPSMLVVHPIEQQLRQIAFSTFVSTYSTYHYANITTESSTIGHITLDGTPISDTAFHPIPNHPDYVYTRLAISPGSHTLASSYGGFNAHLYGIGQAESYSYALGASLDSSNPLAWVNGTPSIQLDSTNNRFCPGDTLHFRAMTVNEDSTQIVWHLGNGQTSSEAEIDMVYTIPGDYTVTVIFTTVAGCRGIRQDTLTLPIHIQQFHNTMCDTSVCGDECLWRGQTYTAIGSFSQYDVSDTTNCQLLTLNILNLYPRATPSIATSEDCDSHLILLFARGDGDFYTWTSSPNDPDLMGHEHDSVIATSPSGTRTYSLYMAYSFDTLCGTTISHTKPDILSSMAWLNDISATMLDGTNNRFCTGDTIHFTASAAYEELTQISWRIHLDEPSASDPIILSAEIDTTFLAPGDYTATAYFSYEDSCLGTYRDSVLLPFTIMARQQWVTDTAVCGDSCVWRDSVYYTSGVFGLYDEADTTFCPRLLTLNLSLIASPMAAIIDSFACDSRLMHLTAQGTGDSYRWSCTPPDSALAGHEHDAYITTSSAGERLYTLYLHYSSDTLCGSTATYLKPDIPVLSANALANPETADAEHTQITLTDISTGATQRCWYLDGTAWSTDSLTLFSYNIQRDSMTVLLVVADSFGCSDTDVIVLHSRMADFWTPNTFTPDAPTNNRFTISSSRLPYFELSIFTRWGDMIWHSTDINEGWDGTYHGIPCPQGTYVYLCRYRHPENGIQHRTGTVTLLR